MTQAGNAEGYSQQQQEKPQQDNRSDLEKKVDSVNAETDWKNLNESRSRNRNNIEEQQA